MQYTNLLNRFIRPLIESFHISVVCFFLSVSSFFSSDFCTYSSSPQESIRLAVLFFGSVYSNSSTRQRVGIGDSIRRIEATFVDRVFVKVVSRLREFRKAGICEHYNLKIPLLRICISVVALRRLRL